MGVVNCISNTCIDSQLSKLFAYLNAWILELAKGIQLIEVVLYCQNTTSVLVSGSDCVSDENNKSIVLVPLLEDSFWKFHSEIASHVVNSLFITPKTLKK